MNKRFILQVLLYNILLEFTRLLKLSFIIGSKTAFFSATNIFGPLAGAYGGSWFALAIFLVRRLIRLIMTGGVGLFNPLGYHIPTFFAAVYWHSSSFFIRLCIPLICMILFIFHPVGSQTYVYSFYWFIPMTLYFVPRQNLFLQALGSTFVAHAVGTILWLYTIPTVPAYWIGLFPVVIVERLVFATGMVMVYHFATGLHKWFEASIWLRFRSIKKPRTIL